jgi:hypothetical protein
MNTSNKLVAIYPGTAAFAAWLEYYRGTKTETRMLACLGGVTKDGKRRPVRPFHVESERPPEKPIAAPMRKETPAPTVLPERRAVGDGEFDAAADRLIARSERAEAESKEKQRRERKLEKLDRIRERALADVAQNQPPKLDDCEQLGVVRVPDPTEAEILIRIGEGPPMRLENKAARPRARIVALRDDPIGKMAIQGTLGINQDRDVRLLAARKFQENYEIAAADGGLDMFVERVGGGCADDIGERRLTAVKELSEASRLLGMRNERMVFEILVEGYTLEEHLKRLGMLEGSQTQQDKVKDAYRQMLRDCLDDLAVLFRFRAVGKGPRHKPDRYSWLAGFTRQPRLYDQMQRPPETPAEPSTSVTAAIAAAYEPRRR